MYGGEISCSNAVNAENNLYCCCNWLLSADTCWTCELSAGKCNLGSEISFYRLRTDCIIAETEALKQEMMV